MRVALDEVPDLSGHKPLFPVLVVEVGLDHPELHDLLAGRDLRLFQNLEKTLPLYRGETLIADGCADTGLTSGHHPDAVAGSIHRRIAERQVPTSGSIVPQDRFAIRPGVDLGDQDLADEVV